MTATFPYQKVNIKILLKVPIYNSNLSDNFRNENRNAKT